jgi:hypothetical protein
MPEKCECQTPLSDVAPEMPEKSESSATVAGPSSVNFAWKPLTTTAGTAANADNAARAEAGRLRGLCRCCSEPRAECGAACLRPLGAVFGRDLAVFSPETCGGGRADAGCIDRGLSHGGFLCAREYCAVPGARTCRTGHVGGRPAGAVSGRRLADLGAGARGRPWAPTARAEAGRPTARAQNRQEGPLSARAPWKHNMRKRSTMDNAEGI